MTLTPLPTPVHLETATGSEYLWVAGSEYLYESPTYHLKYSRGKRGGVLRDSSLGIPAWRRHTL